jgi:hypothetical protein
MIDYGGLRLRSHFQCHFVEIFVNQTLLLTVDSNLSQTRILTSDGLTWKVSTMVASYQFIINAIADYVEIIMLSISVIVFLVSE